MSLISFYGYRHDTTTIELTYRPKSIPASLQSILKHVVFVGRINLGSPEGSYIIVSGSALRTLQVLFVHFVKTPLMERVLAKEMNGWQAQTPTAG